MDYVFIPKEDLRQLLEDVIKSTQNSTAQNVPETAPEGDFIKINEVCSILIISKPTVNLWQNKGLLKPYRIGRRTFHSKTEILSKLKG